MLGLLLNCFKGVEVNVNEVLRFIPKGQYSFGLDMHAIDYTVTENMTASTLLTNTGQQSFEFNNLTIDSGKILASTTKTTSSITSYSPFNIQCHEKLTINGRISASGRGPRNLTKPEFVNIFNQAPGINKAYLSNDTGMIAKLYSVTGPTQSTTHKIYQNIFSYGANAGFFNQNVFFTGTPGYFVNQSPTVSVSYGISSGSGTSSILGGGSGGLIFLYYNKLTADILNDIGQQVIVEYGVDANFPVDRIHANGAGGNCGSDTSTLSVGGGMLVIAAKHIHLGLNGSITADATLPSGVTRTGTNYAFLNNLPQLAYQQSGYYWDNTTQQFVNGTPSNRTYYYSDGSTPDICNKSITTAGNAYLCGGAGAVCGVKVNA